jgi:hypothetical protein
VVRGGQVARVEALLVAVEEGGGALRGGAVGAFLEPGFVRWVGDGEEAVLQFVEVAVFEGEVADLDGVADVRAGEAVGLQFLVDGELVVDAEALLDGVAYSWPRR